MGGPRRLADSRDAVSARLGGLELDLASMTALQNLHRAASAVRHRVEAEVLRADDLSWTGFTVLWVLWVNGPLQTRDVAAEAGITPATLTGVAHTLARKELVRRLPDAADGRRVLLQITPAGEALMTEVFPRFNAQETETVSCLDGEETVALAGLLERVVTHLS
jgi:DNA-binding MarR family transcriptional regulator